MSDPIIIDNLESYRGKFHEYVSRMDVEGLTSLYTENASLMAPNTPTYEGHVKIPDFYTNGFKEGVRNVILSPIEIIDMGDYVAERGSATITVKTSESETLDVNEKYVVLWKRTPEGFKMHWDMFNSNNP